MIKLRRPSWFAVLLALIGVAAFVWLGIWQLNRATQKEQWLQRFAHANQTPAEPLSKVPAQLSPAVYPHVRAQVELLSYNAYVLDDQVHSGRPGVQVYMPALLLPDCADLSAATCHVKAGRALLVDMGFLARPGGNRKLPPIPPLKHARATISGIYAPAPEPGLKLGGDQLAAQSTWPKLTTYVDLKQIGNDLGRPLYPRVLLLDPDPASPYIRAWKPQTMPPARHRAYAFQWFSFAAAVIAIFIIMHRKRAAAPAADDEPKDDPDE